MSDSDLLALVDVRVPGLDDPIHGKLVPGGREGPLLTVDGRSYVPGGTETAWDGVPVYDLEVELRASQADDIESSQGQDFVARVIRRADAAELVEEWRTRAKRARDAEAWLAEAKERQEAAEAAERERNQAELARIGANVCGHEGLEGSSAHRFGLRCELPAGHEGLHMGTQRVQEPGRSRRTRHWKDNGEPIREPIVTEKETTKSVPTCSDFEDEPWPGNAEVRCNLQRGHEGDHSAVVPWTGTRVWWPSSTSEPLPVVRAGVAGAPMDKRR